MRRATTRAKSLVYKRTGVPDAMAAKRPSQQPATSRNRRNPSDAAACVRSSPPHGAERRGELPATSRPRPAGHFFPAEAETAAAEAGEETLTAGSWQAFVIVVRDRDGW